MSHKQDLGWKTLICIGFLAWESGWVAGAIGIGNLADLRDRQTGALAAILFLVASLFIIVGAGLFAKKGEELQIASMAQNEINPVITNP